MYPEIFIVFFILCIIYYIFIYDPRIDFIASDGKPYKIIDSNNKELNTKKAEMLANLNTKAQKIVKNLHVNKLPTEKIANTTYNRFINCVIGEILEKDGGGYTINKGTKMGICLVTKGKLNDENDAFFVILHELAHVMSSSYGHGVEFKQNFNFIVKLAVKLGLWIEKNYNIDPVDYCGVKVTTSPCTTGECKEDNLDYYYKESLLSYK